LTAGKKYLYFLKRIWQRSGELAWKKRITLPRIEGLSVQRRKTMCTMIVEKVKIDGSGKGVNGWFTLQQANVSFDHPFNAPLEHALNIDFVNESQGPSARVAVEMSESAARELVKTILAVLDQAEAGGHL
jgi:hypothetical protein